LPFYDTVIIGAGLAGLSTAYHLRDYTALVLEATPRAGGRVLTRCREGICYDLGAVVSYEPRKVPFTFDSSELIGEYSPIGLFHDDRTHPGDSVLDCLKSALSSAPEVFREIERYATDDEEAELSPPGYELVNAFFKVIHPGEMRDYARSVHHDAFRRYYPSHYANGNEELVSAFVARVKATVQYESEVLSVEEASDSVSVTVRREGAREEVVRARTAVLATPAGVAGRLIRIAGADCARFLSTVRYGEYTIAALGFSESHLGGLSYVVTPSLPPDMICELSGAGGAPKVILAFYGDVATRHVREYSDDEIASEALASVARVSGSRVDKSEVMFRDVQRWPVGGTIISADVYGDLNEARRRASEHVLLAGDYLDAAYPYGMKAAMASGKSAAELVARIIASG
jgi:monoamine oxidase